MEEEEGKGGKEKKLDSCFLYVSAGTVENTPIKLMDGKNASREESR